MNTDDQGLNSMEISLENGRKLDLLLSRFDSVVLDVERHEKLLYGENGQFGLAQQMRVVWRVWTWILCSLSAIIGSALTALLLKWK